MKTGASIHTACETIWKEIGEFNYSQKHMAVTLIKINLGVNSIINQQGFNANLDLPTVNCLPVCGFYVTSQSSHHMWVKNKVMYVFTSLV